MNIFPIGTISGATSAGSIGSLFEPNAGAKSYKVYNNLITPFQNQTLLTRKKSDPFLMLEYEYSDIFSREYRQIEHFVSLMEDGLTSFYVVDWHNGITPSAVVINGSDWKVSLDDTRLFSTVSNQKANKAFLWDGSNWKEGDVISITANSFMIVDIDTNNYGALTLAKANSDAVIYPLYQCFLVPNALENFTKGNFVPKLDITNSTDGGFMMSGTITFVSKYKV
jgi:hypothetical protein